MSERIDARDVHGDCYALLKGVQLARESVSAVEDGAVVGILARDSNLIAMTPHEAAEAATFLLAAAGPDAAREALVKLAPWPFDGETPLETTARLMREKNAAVARASLAEKRLAAVLALTDEELWNAYHAELFDGVLDLIRSRVTEGAEAPTGAAI